MSSNVILDEGALRGLGLRLAEGLRAGSVVALTGDLGTGKTTLTRSIAEGLGVTDPVTSPTFTLINEYGGGRLPLYHFDVYRLGEGAADAGGIYGAMEQLGWEDYFYGAGVCVIEWADMIEEIIPQDAIRIALAHTDKPGERSVAVEGAGI
ncbi:MAG: tRNA (adenosine(37)-N6)-threonylcarbamoyltransferase complex ATPase subunit type 1 TsaE [Clostridiales Family XIII bacterium]|jgi:tRNA threonylcarbamoyladenosine biosynthesis protein TsaE|nr:tRNA (adenosine(37)-N6)-threonylcarbamoyltransferase complex ATPase subunit type 1 TsaE [Clostridiales Family XIII bacterium]